MLDSSKETHNANARVFYSIGKILLDFCFADLFIDGFEIKDIACIRYFSFHFILSLEKLKSIEFLFLIFEINKGSIKLKDISIFINTV